MKRSPMSRGSGFKPRQKPLRATPPAKASVPLLRMRKCPVKKGGCGQSFRPFRPGQISCMDCAVPVGQWLKASKDKAAAKEDRKLTRAAKEAIKRLPTLIAEAQEAFNRYVRFRDVGKSCWTCDTVLVLGGVGGGFDAGHFRPRSQAKHLRFTEDNCFGQCKPCNAPGSVLWHEAIEHAARRIGRARVDELLADNKPRKWQRDEARAIRDEYRRRARELERDR